MMKIVVLALITATGYTLFSSGSYATAVREDFSGALTSVAQVLKSGPLSVPDTLANKITGEHTSKK